MKKHTSYRGTIVDMEMLKFKNQHAVALGNASMNARGDIIGNGGTVIKTREELLAEQEREMQVQDFSPVHQSSSISPAVEQQFEADFDNQFELPEPEEAPQAEPKAPVRRAKTSDK